jgi:prevent-host-death family protein
MDISVAEAKAHLSELIEQVSRGEEVTITKRGKPVARLTPVVPECKPVDIDALRRLTDSMPLQKQSAGEFMRELRDNDRY